MKCSYYSIIYWLRVTFLKEKINTTCKKCLSWKWLIQFRTPFLNLRVLICFCSAGRRSFIFIFKSNFREKQTQKSAIENWLVYFLTCHLPTFTFYMLYQTSLNLFLMLTIITDNSFWWEQLSILYTKVRVSIHMYTIHSMYATH